MPSKVGDAIAYRGRTYLVTSIEKRQAQQFAKESHTEMEVALRSSTNARFIEVLFEPFEEGDVINIFCEWAILQCGEDTQFIYTKYKVKKELDANGSKQQSTDADKAAGTTA